MTTIKGGASQTTVQESVKYLVDDKGMTVQQAIEEVQSILRCKLPEHIVALIKQECG